MTKKNITRIMSFLLPFLLTFLTEITYPINGFTKLKCFLLTCFIYYTFYFFIMGLTKSSKKANIILTVPIVILCISSIIKIAFMAEPLYINDILYIGDASEIGDLVKGSIFTTIKPYFKYIIGLIIGLIILIYVGNKTNIIVESKKARIAMVIVSLLIMITLFAPITFIDRQILNNFFDVNKRLDYECIVNTRRYYRDYGSITGMYGIFLENRNIKPEGYDESKLDKVLDSTKEETNKTFGTPNIIVVFSESFWDLDQQDEIKYDKPITSNFNRLKKEGLFFNMISPSYGGVSANIEFEFLTGATLNYFTPGYVPYMQLYTNKTYYNRPSIIEELQNANYTTKIVQSGSPRLFNCGHFYKYVKFDSTDYMNKKGLEHSKGRYMADSYVTDLTIEELKNKQENEKLFYMILTMQAHMPYTGQNYETYDIAVKNDDIDDKTKEVFLNYGQSIYDADKELGRLYEYIKTYKEPTILIFYGDHLPYLNNGKEDALAKLKYFNTDDEKLNLFRKYNTQALVLANFNIKELQNNKPSYLGPDLLSTYILNNMDLKLSSYYEWLYQTINVIGASNFYINVDQEGNLYYNNELTKEQKEIYELRKMLQYKLFVER